MNSSDSKHLAMEHARISPPLILRNWLATLIENATSHGVRWNDLSTLFLLRFWGQSGKPSLLDKGVHGLLMSKIKSENIVTNFAKSLAVIARVDLSADTLQLERSGGGKHNGGSEGGSVDEETAIWSLLSFYLVNQVKGVLAITRYSTYDEEGVMDITEELYNDTVEDFMRLQADVQEAMECGVDATVCTHQEPDTFPQLCDYLTESNVDFEDLD